MAGLTDMEELVATVRDKDVADYLREALICYGTGAHRACVVLTHIALFDGLRRKVRALAPVNKVAKEVSDQIEVLASAQKVFETPLIQKLKAAGIMTQLEAQTLEQLNNQRNKAAHPSGHVVTAEEARFVFSEAIQKFLSQPIRETSYVVDAVVGKFADLNFFPSTQLGDMTLCANNSETLPSWKFRPAGAEERSPPCPCSRHPSTRRPVRARSEAVGRGSCPHRTPCRPNYPTAPGGGASPSRTSCASWRKPTRPPKSAGSVASCAARVSIRRA